MQIITNSNGNLCCSGSVESLTKFFSDQMKEPDLTNEERIRNLELEVKWLEEKVEKMWNKC